MSAGCKEVSGETIARDMQVISRKKQALTRKHYEDSYQETEELILQWISKLLLNLIPSRVPTSQYSIGTDLL